MGTQFVADVVFTVGDFRAKLFEGSDTLAGDGDGYGFVFSAVSDEDTFAGEGLFGKERFDAWGSEPRESS